MQKDRLTTPATKNINSRSFFDSSNAHHHSKTPTKNSSHDVEKFSFTIESKKKQTIIEKIESLLPYFDILINKTEQRSVRMVERFIDLKDLIDQIFEDINDQFENANLENQELRQALRRRSQIGNASHPELQRRIENMIEEIRLLKRSKEQTENRLYHSESQKRQAYGLLEQMKNEVERIKRQPSDRQNSELRSLREQLDGFKRKGIEQNRRREQDRYEEERAYQNAKKRRQNQDGGLQNRLRQIRKLQNQNGDLHSRLEQFKRLSDLGQDEIRRLKSDFDNQRRQSVLNEEGLIRKLKSLDDQKTKLLRQVQAQEGKAQQKDRLLRSLQNEYQKERRNTIQNAREQTARIRDLERYNSEIQNQGGYKIRQLEQGIKQKQRKLQQYIHQLTKKSNLDQNQIRALAQELQNQRRRTMADQGKIRTLEGTIEEQRQKAKGQIKRLQQALDEQRRKSMADENKIKNLQRILNEKVHLINENEGRNVLARDQLAFLKNEIEKERRNSVVDQQKIRKLQNLLGQKQKYMTQINNRHSMAERDIDKLQKMIQQQRRKSSADQAKIKKLQSLLNDKLKQANATHNKYLDLVRKSDLGDAQIKALKDELDNQRRKSNADQQRIKKIQYLLKQREKQITDERNKRGDYERQIGFLQSEIDKERRNSMADQQKIKKLEQMKGEKELLLQQYNKKYQDQMRITDVNAEEIKFLKAQLDNQRRKSNADENTIRNLQKVIQQKQKVALDHKNKHLNEIRFLKEEIDNQRKKSFADEAKIRKLQEILSQKLKEDENQRKHISDLMRKSELGIEELRMLKQVLDEERRKSVLDQNLIKKLQGVIKNQVSQLKDKENHFTKNNRDIQQLKHALDQERKKSFADEATIRKLQQLLKQKTDESAGQYKKYLESMRKSQLNQEQLRFLKQAMQKERRQSAAQIEGYNRKVRDLEGIKDNLTGKIDEDRRRLAETGNYVKQLEEKSGNIEKLYNDANRKNASALQQLDTYRNEIENQRRKSTALEGKLVPKIQQLTDQNQGLVGEIQNLKRKQDEGQQKIKQLLSQIQRMRRRVGQLQGVQRQQREVIGQLQRQLNNRDQNAKRVIEQGVDELKNLQGQLHRTRAQKQKLKEQINSNLRQTSVFKENLQRAQNELRLKSQSLAEQVNNNENLGALLNDLKKKQQQLLSRNEQLVRQNTQNSLIYQSHLQNYLTGVQAKVTQSVVGAPLNSINNVNANTGFGDSRQKTHVIRVLKHQSNVYKLQTLINKQLKGELSDTSQDRY